MITRYKKTGRIVTVRKSQQTEIMTQDPNGEWVRYEDHKKELNYLLDELEDIDDLGVLAELLRERGRG